MIPDHIDFNPKVKLKFMGEEFEMSKYAISGELLIILAGLMVCGKEYYDLLKSVDCRIGDDKLWAFIENKFKDGG